MKKQASQEVQEAKLNSVVVITVLTSDPARRDQIDRLIDNAFLADRSVQVIRVVGYPSADTIAKVVSQLDEVTKAEETPATGTAA